VTPSATSENNWGVVRLIANLPFCRRFLRPPSTKAPSLHRSYPASSVLRASPPSQTARPFSPELPVDSYFNHRGDFPCCVWSPLPACRRQYPGRSHGICSLVPFHSLRPSPKPGRVGSCISLFEACSAFTHVTACTLAKSPSDSLHRRLQQLRCLRRCFDCYRVERTSSRTGLTLAVDHHLFTAHPVTRLMGTCPRESDDSSRPTAERRADFGVGSAMTIVQQQPAIPVLLHSHVWNQFPN
jgi:hypothetical protein